MWQFLEKVYDGNGGGLGLLVAFCVLVAAIGQIADAIIKRRKV